MSYGDTVLADSPSGYWPFVGGALTDASGNSRAMTAYNSPVYGTDGPIGGSTGRYYCNKVASPQISNGMRRSGIALPTDGTCKFTAEFWVKSTEANAGRTLFRHADTSSSSTTWYIHSAASQKITAGLAGSKSVTSATSVLDGNWHHVVFVIDDPGDAITLYVDGSSDASNTGITVPTQGARYWAIGVFSGLTDTAAHYAAHPAVYHGTALSAARVAAHYEAATQVTSSVSSVIAVTTSVIGTEVVPSPTGALQSTVSVDTIVGGREVRHRVTSTVDLTTRVRIPYRNPAIVGSGRFLIGNRVPRA